MEPELGYAISTGTFHGPASRGTRNPFSHHERTPEPPDRRSCPHFGVHVEGYTITIHCVQASPANPARIRQCGADEIR
jgi:hypothetical protein